MKKKILIVTVAVIVAAAALLALTSVLAGASLAGRLWRVDNVYDEMWNLLSSEKRGGATVLTEAFDGAEVDYDLGSFDHVSIPLDDGCRASLSFYEGKLCIWLYEDDGSACYLYDHQSNTLYGNREAAYLDDRFMSLYCSQVGDGSGASSDGGEYTFELVQYPLSYSA